MLRTVEAVCGNNCSPSHPYSKYHHSCKEHQQSGGTKLFLRKIPALSSETIKKKDQFNPNFSS